jgi:hypothetical protein
VAHFPSRSFMKLFTLCSHGKLTGIFFRYPIYLQSVMIHSANGGKGKGWHVEEYSVALLC